MKLFLNSLVSIMVMGLVVAGCGKDGGGGGGGGGYAGFISSNHLNQQDQAYLAEIQNWYNQTEVSNLRKYAQIKQNIAISNGGSCPGEIKEYFGFIRVCVYSGGSGSTTNQTVVKYLVSAGAAGSILNPYYCVTTDGYNCSSGQTHQTYPGKAGNAKLQEAISGRSGTLHLLKITKMGSVYQLSFGTSPLNTYPSFVYKIDTSLHSLYNPVEVTDLASAQPTSEWISFYY